MRSNTALAGRKVPGRHCGGRVLSSSAVLPALRRAMCMTVCIVMCMAAAIALVSCASSGAKSVAKAAAKAAAPEATPDAETAAAEAAAAALLAAETAAKSRVWTFAELSERVWHLAAIKVGHGVIFLDRAAMKTAGQGDIYVLQFKEEGINGKAVFNYYFAPYARREGNDIGFRQIVGTRQGSSAGVNVAGLGEEEYYWYLQRVTRWQVSNDRLALYAPSGESEIVLYFTLG